MTDYLIFLYFASPRFTDTAIFHRLKVCGTVSEKFVSSVNFPMVLARFAFLCYILAILTLFRTFPLLLYALCCSVVSGYGLLKTQMMVSIF